jgi:uncharacterized protein YndB with AHSA1/START domain
LYAAWLDGERHGAFTGGTANVESHIGGRHTAWDGYIEGEILELEPNRRIVQSWRSLDFPNDAPYSRLELVMTPTSDGGTEVQLIHSEIPEGQGDDYKEGWVSHYFEPMQRYFRGEPVLLPVLMDEEPPKNAAPAKRKAAPAKKVKVKVKAKAKSPAKKRPAKKAKPAKKISKKAKSAKKAKKPAKKKGKKR